jgi:hypothetical protein
MDNPIWLPAIVLSVVAIVALVLERLTRSGSR